MIAPSNTEQSKATVIFPIIKDNTRIEAVAIPDTPLARPSRPSIKLIALEIPTIHSRVIG